MRRFALGVAAAQPAASKKNAAQPALRFALQSRGGAYRFRANSGSRAARARPDQETEHMFITPAYAQAAGGAAANPIVQFLPLILIFVIMYFLMIRPQQKKLKDHKAMVEALRRGDQVVTQGGIIGKISRVKEGEQDVEVEIAEGVKVRVVKSTISQVLSKTEPAATK